MTQRESHWFNRTFAAGSRPKKVIPRPDAETRIRMETRALVTEEHAALLRTYEHQTNATVGWVRAIVEARAKAARAELDLLDEEPAGATPTAAGEGSPGFSSSGSGSNLGAPPAASETSPGPDPLPPQVEDDFLRGVAFGYDMALRALGVPEPQSLKAPTLKVVK